MSEIVKLNGYDLKDKESREQIQILDLNRIKTHENVESMKLDLNLQVGMHVKTKGYYEINDGGHSEYVIVDTTENNKYYEELNNGLYAELIVKNSIANIRQFGAKGDGLTDDTDKIQLCIDLFDTIIIPSGTFMIKAHDDNYVTGSGNHDNINYNGGLKLKSNLTIKGTNRYTSILKAITTGNDNYNIMRGYNISNIYISDLTIYGDKETHTGYTGEYGHGIMLLNSDNCIINNCIIKQLWGDGIYIGILYGNTIDKQTNNIQVTNNIIDYASRNGISICSVENCKILNNMITHVNRTNPKSGIDIEPEGNGTTKPFLKDIVIDELFLDSCFYGISFYYSDQVDITKYNNIDISNSKCIGGNIGLLFTTQVLNQSFKGYFKFYNLTFIKNGWCSIQIKDHFITMPEMTFKDIRIVDCNDVNHNTDDNPTGWTQGSGFVINASDDTNEIGNITIENLETIDTRTSKYINKGYAFINGVGSNIRLINPIKLDELHSSRLTRTILLDNNKIRINSGSYYIKLLNQNNINSIYEFKNVNSDAFLEIQDSDDIPNGTVVTLINNHEYAGKIDLGEETNRIKLYPFSNSNRYITTNDYGATITFTKINNQWITLNYTGNWTN